MSFIYLCFFLFFCNFRNRSIAFLALVMLRKYCFGTWSIQYAIKSFQLSLLLLSLSSSSSPISCERTKQTVKNGEKLKNLNHTDNLLSTIFRPKPDTNTFTHTHKQILTRMLTPFPSFWFSRSRSLACSLTFIIIFSWSDLPIECAHYIGNDRFSSDTSHTSFSFWMCDHFNIRVLSFHFTWLDLNELVGFVFSCNERTNDAADCIHCTHLLSHTHTFWACVH